MTSTRNWDVLRGCFIALTGVTIAMENWGQAAGLALLSLACAVFGADDLVTSEVNAALGEYPDIPFRMCGHTRLHAWHAWDSRDNGYPGLFLCAGISEENWDRS